MLVILSRPDVLNVKEYFETQLTPDRYLLISIRVGAEAFVIGHPHKFIELDVICHYFKLSIFKKWNSYIKMFWVTFMGDINSYVEACGMNIPNIV